MRDQDLQIEKDERSIGSLFSQLAAETGTLVRQEVALAQAEITEKATGVGRNIGSLVIGGAVGYAALLAILAGLIIALSNFIPAWGAAMLLGVLVGGVSYVMVSSALAELRKKDLRPDETVESLKEDAQWLKRQMT